MQIKARPKNQKCSVKLVILIRIHLTLKIRKPIFKSKQQKKYKILKLKDSTVTSTVIRTLIIKANSLVTLPELNSTKKLKSFKS